MLLVGTQVCAATIEKSMEFPQDKLKTEIPNDAAIPLLGMQLKSRRSLSQKDACIHMSAAALVTTV